MCTRWPSRRRSARHRCNRELDHYGRCCWHHGGASARAPKSGASRDRPRCSLDCNGEKRSQIVGVSRLCHRRRRRSRGCSLRCARRVVGADVAIVDPRQECSRGGGGQRLAPWHDLANGALARLLTAPHRGNEIRASASRGLRLVDGVFTSACGGRRNFFARKEHRIPGSVQRARRLPGVRDDARQHAAASRGQHLR